MIGLNFNPHKKTTCELLGSQVVLDVLYNRILINFLSQSCGLTAP